ncbi:TP901 family phage tail tape measure protein [Sphingomonas sp. SORGH_AS870]|uniref:phage tail tape measure protein n=1 Tax=Sphingomonas sp. SORGH_AS_0870 TaxID=3041801 RepID=UPI00285CFA70|nr:phage tail tape measure protein [Sphingomonas sp. SORGH_AS_0870]MDR6144963.1 TP901 family phage tail tape measure protein [Sphingomonas sp. SORGH_AS_0870]
MDRNLRIQVLMEASDRLTRPLRDMANGGTRAAQALRGTREQMESLQRAQGSIGAFRTLRAGLQSTTHELAAARTRVGELRAAMAATETPSRAMARDLTRAENAVSRLTNQQRRQAAELRTTRADMRSAGIGVRDLAEHEERLGREIEETTRHMAEQSRRVEQLAARQRRLGAARESFSRTQGMAGGMAASGAAGIGGAIALAAPLVASSRGAMDLEEGMAGVAKVTGMAQGPLAAMQDRLVALSERIPMTAVDLSNIAAAAGAAGVGMDKFGRPLPSQAEDLVAFTDAAARMGIAFDMSAEDAGGTMAKWRQAFKMTQPEVEALGDRVNALTNKFGGKADAVAGIVTRIGPLGEVAGIAAAQISALASSLNSIGVEEEVAATGIKNTLLTLTKGAAATKSQQAAFKALGLDAVKVAKAMQVNASGTIVDVLERVGRLSKDQQASQLSELFGTESVGAIAPLLTNLDGLKQRLGLVGDKSQYAGSMTGEFLSRINTTKGATDLAKNAFEAVNITLGQALLPTIKSGAQFFAGLAKGARAFAQAHPVMAKGAMVLVGALGVLFGLFSVGMIAIAGIMGPIALLNAGLIAMGTAGGIAAVGFLPIIGTLAAVVGGIAAVAGAVYLIYSNWGAITGFFGSLWNGVKAVFSMSLGQILTGLAGFIGAALGTLYRFGGAAGVWLTGTLPGLLGRGWDVAWGAFKAAIRAAFTTLPRLFFDFGGMIVTGLMNGVANAPGRLWSAGVRMAKALAGGFKSAAQIHSPSRVFMALGGHVIGGLDKGLDDAAGAPVARMARLTRQMAAVLAVPAVTMPAMAALSSPPPVMRRLVTDADNVRTAINTGDRARRDMRQAVDRPRGMASAPAPAAPSQYHFHINQLPGQSAEDLARAIRRELEDYERSKAASARSTYRDDPDGADL